MKLKACTVKVYTDKLIGFAFLVPIPKDLIALLIVSKFSQMKHEVTCYSRQSDLAVRALLKYSCTGTAGLLPESVRPECYQWRLVGV